jgi:hypothetical protein
LAPSGGVGIESDPNFNKLSSRDRELHLWAMSQPRNQIALRANVQITPGCVAEADAITEEHRHPPGDKPIVDVSKDMGRGPITSDYRPSYCPFLKTARRSLRRGVDISSSLQARRCHRCNQPGGAFGPQ